ncbi:transcriptional regulator [Geodermatophilus sp. YIM 151500]|uniref:sugar-binding transcriptional regulator n=1 Tax=Geodermatophilus sp. YIM 151500 TaxID=2984531 RepID=UPI0021E40EA6|nr:sugar-binding domain-containing protein [Geodermatophilus sp. YIM 151500]MCV2489895.1 transcriptional regulator [Geodermatophilus sp. YIM 151500]
MTVPPVGPAALVLSASVARRYYLDGRSKVEIAEEFGLSRFKVARLIDGARDSGLVRIEIGHHGVVDVDLSARLGERFALQHAVVAAAEDESTDALRTQVGRVAAELLAEIVGPDDVLGVAWSRSVGAMARELPRLAPVPVVQLTGALAMPDGDANAIDIVRDVARAAGGPAYVFYAPFTLPDAATARALRRQREVALAFDQLPRVTKAVVGIGLWAPGRSTLYDTAGERDRTALRQLGVQAEMSGVFLRADGEPVAAELAERMIGIGAEQMRAIPEVVVLAYGTAKVPAARAALRSGLVGGLVTHRSFAQALLDEA